MRPITAAEAAAHPIVTDADIEARVVDLIGRACRRQLWMLFIDVDSVQLRTLVPIEDYPLSPVDGAAKMLAACIREIMVKEGGAQVILVWERRISEGATPADRAWAKGLGEACREEGVSVRAQLISHRSGVRWFPPDDYA